MIVAARKTEQLEDNIRAVDLQLSDDDVRLLDAASDPGVPYPKWMVVLRKSPGRLAFSSIDRLVFAGMYALAPNILDALKIAKPETVLRWHRAGFRAYWRWKARSRGGRPSIPAEIRDVICKMSIANPLREHLASTANCSSSASMSGRPPLRSTWRRPGGPPSQGWKTFLVNHADGIAAMDLFVVPTISFRLVYGVLILLHGAGSFCGWE